MLMIEDRDLFLLRTEQGKDAYSWCAPIPQGTETPHQCNRVSENMTAALWERRDRNVTVK